MLSSQPHPCGRTPINGKGADPLGAPRRACRVALPVVVSTVPNNYSTLHTLHPSASFLLAAFHPLLVRVYRTISASDHRSQRMESPISIFLAVSLSSVRAFFAGGHGTPLSIFMRYKNLRTNLKAPSSRSQNESREQPANLGNCASIASRLQYAALRATRASGLSPP